MEQQSAQQHEHKKSLKHRLFEIYDKKYKLLLIIPFLLLAFSLIQIGYQVYSTGDFIIRDVSLKGGVTITIPYGKLVDTKQVEKEILSKFSGNEIIVRSLRTATSIEGIIVEADIDGNNKAQVDGLLAAIGSSLKIFVSLGIR